ncbi:Surfactin synthase thioesterase subunit [Paenibacillus sp. CF095]|nr:Surfactin synthase thioesterase subunit [Paenibacillus sp. CF095]
MKLFCFPYAGGSATAYQKWNRFLSNSIELYPVELAGRGAMSRIPLYINFCDMVEEVFSRIQPHLMNGPYAFFGHSMGGRLSFELGQKIRELGMKGPETMFISGCGAPNFEYNRVKYHLLSNEEFKLEVVKLGGIPEEILLNTDIFDYYLPILRSDFRNLETFLPRYNYELLDSNFHLFHGDDDKIPLQAVDSWNRFTSRSYQMEVFSGGHFFINNYTEQITRIINDTLIGINKL